MSLKMAAAVLDFDLKTIPAEYWIKNLTNFLLQSLNAEDQNMPPKASNYTT